MDRRYSLIISLCIGLVLITTPSMARHTATSVNDMAGGLAATRHNLSSSGSFINTPLETTAGPFTWASGTSEICVFCHTPHYAKNADGAPLWNRSGATSAGSYTNYGANVGYGGSTYAGKTTVGNPTWATLACLTCHDGVTTFDALVNRPGKGIGAPDFWTFRMGTNPLFPASENLDHFDTSVNGPCEACHGTLSGLPSLDYAAGRMIIGTDLTDDHPVSFKYRENITDLRPKTTVIANISMCNWQEDGTCPDPLVKPPGYSQLWAVDGYINPSATIDDLLRGTAGQLECSSCHDPHYKNQTNPDTSFVGTYRQSGGGGTPATDHDDMAIDGLFLRRVGGNSDSGLCRTCHAKADQY